MPPLGSTSSLRAAEGRLADDDLASRSCCRRPRRSVPPGESPPRSRPSPSRRCGWAGRDVHARREVIQLPVQRVAVGRVGDHGGAVGARSSRDEEVGAGNAGSADARAAATGRRGGVLFFMPPSGQQGLCDGTRASASDASRGPPSEAASRPRPRRQRPPPVFEARTGSPQPAARDPEARAP